MQLQYSTTLMVILCGASSVSSLACWQCASVDGRKCPENAKMINSDSHDACITWRLGNRSVILQNVVNFDDECTDTKISFWTRFINLYYQSTGGEVRCCTDQGCNTGSFSDENYVSTSGNSAAGPIPGPPLIFGSVSNAPNSAALPPTAVPSVLASNLPNYAFMKQNTLINPLAVNTVTANQLAAAMAAAGIQTPQQQLLATRRQQQQLVPNFQNFVPQQASPPLTVTSVDSKQRVRVNPAPTVSQFDEDGVERNGNCQKYFSKKSANEWLPTTLIPLSFDRASRMKIGVFYARFKAAQHHHDEFVVRLVDSSRSNASMYTFNMYRVGTVSLFTSKLKPDHTGKLRKTEQHLITRHNIAKLADTEFYRGFWFAVKNDEISLGEIGTELIHPLLVWNDTLREGPRDVSYFALTTARSEASFGVNCDVPSLHFPDTCVSDDDCEDYPNTVCTQEPVNEGLDPGTRDEPFDSWGERATLLKSCFCRQGHVRIPKSRGCYDPIQQVSTIGDACFAHYHCHSLPNTQCLNDSSIPIYNKSCQCIAGNKAFEPDHRTGLIEGCAPLTDADRASVLGCENKFLVEDNFEWQPEQLFSLKHDPDTDSYYSVVYIKLNEEVRIKHNVAIIRLMDAHKNPRKMLTVKFYKNTGKISIAESKSSRSFFYEIERDSEKASINDLDLTTRMQLEYVGFWIMYKYTEGQGGTLSVGLNGAPFSNDFALVKWTDSSHYAIRSMRHIGFTASQGSTVNYGTNCLLLDAIGKGSKNPLGPLNQKPSAITSQLVNQNIFSSNVNRVNPITPLAQLNQVQALQNLQNLQNLQAFQALRSAQAYSSGALVRHQGRPGFGQTSGTASNANPFAVINRRGVERGEKDKLVAKDPSVIIEPVLRNEYLTKIKQLLPALVEQDLQLAAIQPKSDFILHDMDVGESNVVIQEAEYVDMQEDADKSEKVEQDDEEKKAKTE